MKDVKLPPEWTSVMRSPRTKAALFSKIESKRKQDCKNCGGMGVMYMFVGTSGPFKEVPKGIGKWDGTNWWLVRTLEVRVLSARELELIQTTWKSRK